MVNNCMSANIADVVNTKQCAIGRAAKKHQQAVYHFY